MIVLWGKKFRFQNIANRILYKISLSTRTYIYLGLLDELSWDKFR